MASGKTAGRGTARKKAKPPAKKKTKVAVKKMAGGAANKKAKPSAKNMAAKRRAQKKTVKMMAAKAKARAANAKKPSGAGAAKKPASAPAKQRRTAAVHALPSAAEKRRPRCIVLAGFGLNAEAELAHAFCLAGADAKIVHFSDISSGREKLSHYEIFAIPGGWSFGDDIAGGRVLSNKLKSTFRAQFDEFVSSGKPMLGVCNGFQTLVKLGALPNLSGSSSQESTLTFNKSGRFEDRWVYLKPQKSVCKYFEGVSFIQCPVRHGEGQFVPRDSELLASLKRQGMVALRYTDEKMSDSPGYPANPNGSPYDIAGICDRTGKILGLMPHPECSMYRTQFPRFTAGISYEKNSLRFFQNIVKAAEEYVR
ncbi:MAG: phosphoribosylformylglycinamidine synthase subunit PurQ [Candidatus Micrarchaeia archaeon]